MNATLGSNMANQFQHVLSIRGLRRVMPCILIIVCMFSLLEISGFGQNPGASGPIQPAPDPADIAALMQKIRDLEDRIIVMEGQIKQLNSQQMADQSGANPLGGRAGGWSISTGGDRFARHANGRTGWGGRQRGKSTESRHQRDWRFYRSGRTQCGSAFTLAANARIGSRTASHPRSLRARRLLPCFW